MSSDKFFSRSLALIILLAAGPASALQFDVFGEPLKVETLFTVGASWRMQDVDPTLIGKSTLWRISHPNQGLCVTRDNNTGTYSASAATNDKACSQSDLAANQFFVAAPGSFSPNGDNGDLNFAKGDIVHAMAKVTSDISFSFHDYNFFVRPVYFFDQNYHNFTETHFDQSFQPEHTQLNKTARTLVGNDLQFLDYNVSHVFHIGERDLSVKVGNQIVNWGESSLLVFNSLNTINALDATKVRFPGADIKEFFQPQGMVTASTELIKGNTIEGWYQYQWKSLRVDPPGTFFSQSDTLGPGGTSAMLGFAKNPDDPNDIYSVYDNSHDPASALGTHAGRTIYRDGALEKEHKGKGGDFGIALKTFLESFNNGTDVAFYFANYTSRFPIVSAISADATCANDISGVVAPAPTGCGITPGAPNTSGANDNARDILPLDTMRLFVEYPTDIHLFGVSFNTTVGDFALSGEYAYRPNLPVQIHTVDLTFAALNAATPDENIPLGPAAGPYVGVIPGCRYLFPDFVSRYRGVRQTRGDARDGTADQCGYGPNQYIQGYERLKVGQANLTVLRLIGGDNPLGASQMTFLLETGLNQVFNMPSLDQLQFQGGGTDLHISHGADGTAGILPPDSPAGDQTAMDATPCPSSGSPQAAVNPRCVRANPTTNTDHDGFGSAISYGYRFVNLSRWDSALFGANIETLTLIQHDVKGTTPGLGTNFVQGRKQMAFGVRFDYLATYLAEVRYSWNFGGALRDGLRDRDNIFVSLGYQF